MTGARIVAWVDCVRGNNPNKVIWIIVIIVLPATAALRRIVESDDLQLDQPKTPIDPIRPRRATRSPRPSGSTLGRG